MILVHETLSIDVDVVGSKKDIEQVRKASKQTRPAP
jgi:hypothetical protein